MKITKMIGLPLCVLWNNIFFSQKAEYSAKIGAQTKTKKIENVRHYAREVQISVKKSSCNEPAALINTKFYDIFTLGFLKK